MDWIFLATVKFYSVISRPAPEQLESTKMLAALKMRVIRHLTSIYSCSHQHKRLPDDEGFTILSFMYSV